MAAPTNIDAWLLITDQSGDIKNESTDSVHTGYLQIQNFSFGVELQSNSAIGTGLGAGKSVAKQFEFDINNSKASPVLFKHCCDGTHCKTAALYIRKAGGGAKDYYVWKFKDLVITKFEVTCSDDILEKIAFSFTAIWCEYKPQKPDGSLDSGVNGGWNVKENQPWGGS